MKTSELTGAALDWAVAKCEGKVWEAADSFIAYHDDGEMNYSVDWSEGGPIIQREKIGVNPASLPCSDWWADTQIVRERTHQHGPTPLIAAMRCYVASKLGEEVDIPAELRQFQSRTCPLRPSPPLCGFSFPCASIGGQACPCAMRAGIGARASVCIRAGAYPCACAYAGACMVRARGRALGLPIGGRAQGIA